MPGGCSTSQTTIFMTTKASTKCSMDENKHSRRVFIDRRSGAHRLGVPMKQAKDTVKRQGSIMEDSGEREQYSKMSIFGRIYQHTREQKTFTLNHHHTTTPDKR